MDGSPSRRVQLMAFASTLTIRYCGSSLNQGSKPLTAKHALAQSYTLQLVNVMSDNKDNPAMADQFEIIIDRVEAKYDCVVIYFTTDSDGGSKKGCVLLGKCRPWMLTPSCWGHQVSYLT
jgi:hypothetical protein